MDSRVTLKDVAKACGKARSTVSMALQGHPRIAESTRRQVEEVADQLGYRPDPGLTALAAYRHRKSAPGRRVALGIVHSWPSGFASNRFWSRAVAAMKQEAEMLGYTIEMLEVTPGADSARTATRILRARGVEGILLPPTPGFAPPVELDWDQFVVVGLETGRPSRRMHHVIRDFFDATVTTYSELVQSGCRRIALSLSPGLKPEVGDLMVGGFMAAHHAKQPASRRLLLADFPNTDDLAQWLREVQPEALIDWNVAKLLPISEGNYNLPRTPICATCLGIEEIRKTDLAGVRFSTDLLGREAVKALHRLILANERGLTSRPLNLLVGGSWLPASASPTAS